MKHSLILVAAYSAVAFGALPAMGADISLAGRAGVGPGNSGSGDGGSQNIQSKYRMRIDMAGTAHEAGYAHGISITEMIMLSSGGSTGSTEGEVTLWVNRATTTVSGATNAAVVTSDDVIRTVCDPSCSKEAVTQYVVEEFGKVMAGMKTFAAKDDTRGDLSLDFEVATTSDRMTITESSMSSDPKVSHGITKGTPGTPGGAQSADSSEWHIEYEF